MLEQYEIYYCELDGVGSEQQGLRPCVILQNNVGNTYSTTTIIAPITLQAKPIIPTHVYIDDVVKGTIMLEQIRVVDKARMKNKVMEIKDEKLIEKIKQATKISLGMEE